ncbi:MAG: hypothetical protein IH951_06880 [Bacteroidetes bacterium]|nr:hypothetical protein [Bacteroidota bacterium]
MRRQPRRDHDLDLFFLGSKSEQRQFLLEAVQLVLNDHIFWRRNYHPKDPPPIPYPVIEGEDARHYKELFFTELFSLISDLKLDVPVFSPRYMAHMVSESTLPSLVAYYATLLYNPNNVSSEGSSVTIRYELEVGEQFAELFGFPIEQSFGHITSGGTIANYESLWYIKAGRFLPLSLAMARSKLQLSKEKLTRDSFWNKMNVPLSVVDEDLRSFLEEAASTPTEAFDLLRPFLIMYTGDREFQRLIENEFRTEWKDPVLIVPYSAHYSWSRAASLFGIGKFNLVKLDVDEEFRVRPESFQSVLERCAVERIPIIQTVVVAGSTEFGSVDPIGELVSVRDEMSVRGLYTPIHVDAAFGGYFATMFKSGQRHSVNGESDIFCHTPWLKEAMSAIGACDSVTIDPHKAGFIPYGAGCIVLKHGFLKEIVAETASYCLDSSDTTSSNDDTPQLGRFILEGSKPGAAAAATWFSHRLIPLDMDGYGRQLTVLCRIARRFESSLRKAEDTSFDGIKLVCVNKPHLNIVCLFALPDDAMSFKGINLLNAALAKRFGVRNVLSIQSYDYLLSHTVISKDFPYISQQPQLKHLVQDADAIDVLRLVFMNRWVEEKENTGRTYLEAFQEKLLSEAARIWKEIRSNFIDTEALVE